MRLLFLAPQPFLRERGTPLRARNILAALTGAGHQVEMLCYPFGEDVTMSGLQLRRSARVPGISDVGIGPSAAKILLDVPFALRALRMCLRSNVDAIQAVEEAGLFAWVPARLRHRPFVYQMDSWISEQLVFSGFATRGPALALARWLERAAMRSAALVITVGPDHAAEVRRIAPHAQVLVLPDAPAADHFVPDEAGAARWRKRLGLGEARCVVYTGNFEPYQGVDLLVRAAGRMTSAQNGVRVVLVGGRPDQIREMEALAKASGAGDVCVFAGTQPPAEMTAFLSLADVLVSPRCRGRNPPMKIYTYLQAGRPIVATRVPTHTQVLDDEISLLADPDPAALATALDAALADADRSARIVAAARERFEREFSPARFRERLLRAIEQLGHWRASPPSSMASVTC
ncbi:MAG: glycosyltransferase family 4 protein [Kiritimatiellae bacterium]|nr:glycosyltransferase family 4 protein [Kiritimatiellia bacterium]